MQQELFIEHTDYSQQKVLVGLSGGINSMAVLCWLANYPSEYKPKQLHLFYAHFEEHSPDTLDFVLAGVEYAKRNFESVIYVQTNNSVLEFFRKQNFIPHPMIASCTRELKIKPMLKYAEFMPNHAKIGQYNAITYTGVQAVETGEMSPEEAAEMVVEELEIELGDDVIILD